MKRLITLSLLATCAITSAQSMVWEYAPKNKQVTQLVSTKFGTLTGVPLFGELDVSVVGGVQYHNGALTVGGMLSRSYRLGTFDYGGERLPVYGVVGVTGRVAGGKLPQFGGIAFGIEWRL